MSKTADALSRLQNQRVSPSSPDADDSSGRGTERFGSALAVIFWLATSIAATMFSYSLGVRQGERTSQEASPRQWQYYYSDLEMKESAGVSSGNSHEAVPAQPEKRQPAKVSAPSVPVPDSRNTPAAVIPGGFTIQVVTYGNKELAQREIDRLNKNGFKAFMIPSGSYQQVCVNRYESKPEARQALTQFHADGHARTYPGAYVRPFGSPR